MSRGWFISALGAGQIASWGTLYYAFPLLAGPMEADLGAGRVALYGAPTIGLLVAALGAWPIGALIDRGHGRAVMAGGALLGAVLLALWSRVDGVTALYLLFAGVGLAQAMTLYEPAFAVVARRYGAEARQGITTLTLWGGFASTVFVPVVQGLLSVTGWRETVLVLALVNLLLCLPAYAWAIDRRRDAPVVAPPPPVPAAGASQPAGRPAVAWALGQPVFWLLAATFTLYYGLFSALTYHLYPLLLESGLSPAAVVGTMALIGPAQVAGRLVVWTLARRQSVQVVGGVTVAVLPLAITLLLAGPGSAAALAAFALLYGAANGIMTIVRGMAVPEMLTRAAYGSLSGLIALPATLAKALAPAAAAMLWALDGAAYGLMLAVVLAGSGVVAVAFWAACALSLRQAPAAEAP